MNQYKGRRGGGAHLLISRTFPEKEVIIVAEKSGTGRCNYSNTLSSGVLTDRKWGCHYLQLAH